MSRVAQVAWPELIAAIDRFFAEGPDYCEACGGDGYLEEMLPGASNASEPSYLDVPCPECSDDS